MSNMVSTPESVRLTQFSHGAGCGCKISPAILNRILSGNETGINFPGLLVGNQSRDDAAVLQIDSENCLISTTDFFMPVVDDAFDFGRIAAANAISDVYAMGGNPVLAIAILGWPVDKLSPEIAGLVIKGGKQACADAGIPMAGGHSIDSPEPIFGLAVNGMVKMKNLKKNNSALPGDKLFLTKKLGIGIITTASKKGKVQATDLEMAVQSMCTLNAIGAKLGLMEGVTALTDVTGFGLGGHLSEMAAGSDVSAHIYRQSVPVFECAESYIALNCIPGGTMRNWQSYGQLLNGVSESDKLILCDPQTSGGLLVAVRPQAVEAFKDLMLEEGFDEFTTREIGEIITREPVLITVR